MKSTPVQRSEAKMHATVWERAQHELTDAAERRRVDGSKDAGTLAQLAIAALFIGGEYRRIANGADVDD